MYGERERTISGNPRELLLLRFREKEESSGDIVKRKGVRYSITVLRGGSAAAFVGRTIVPVV